MQLDISYSTHKIIIRKHFLLAVMPVFYYNDYFDTLHEHQSVSSIVSASNYPSSVHVQQGKAPQGAQCCGRKGGITLYLQITRFTQNRFLNLSSYTQVSEDF